MACPIWAKPFAAGRALVELKPGGTGGDHMRRRGYRAASVALVAAGILSAAGPAFPTPRPPTNGGNGARVRAASAPDRPTSGRGPVRAARKGRSLRGQAE